MLRGGVCAKTGAPADAIIEMRVVHTPAWIWILLIFGIFPMLVAYAFTRKEVRIEVPAAEEVARRRKDAGRLIFGTLVGSILLIASGATTQTEAGIWVGAAGIVVVVMALPFAARGWINATYDGQRVHLSRLHPNYVQAVGG